MLDWLTSPVSVVPCVLQNGQANAWTVAVNRSKTARDNPRRGSGPNIGGYSSSRGRRCARAGGWGGLAGFVSAYYGPRPPRRASTDWPETAGEAAVLVM